jgi:hypothetical protein
MPREGAITFGDLVGRLEELRVACDKCSRAGRYRLDRLIAEHGPDVKIRDWLVEISRDCPKRQAASASDRCDAHCADLLRVFRSLREEVSADQRAGGA